MDREKVKTMSYEKIKLLYDDKENTIKFITKDLNNEIAQKGSTEYRILIETRDKAQRDLIFIQRIMDER